MEITEFLPKVNNQSGSYHITLPELLQVSRLSLQYWQPLIEIQSLSLFVIKLNFIN